MSCQCVFTLKQPELVRKGNIYHILHSILAIYNFSTTECLTLEGGGKRPTIFLPEMSGFFKIKIKVHHVLET